MGISTVVVLGGGFALFFGALPLLWAPALVLAYLALAGKWEPVRNALVTLPRDLDLLYRMVVLFVKMKYYESRGIISPMVFDKIALSQPDKVAFRYLEESWTYRQVYDYTETVATLFNSLGVKEGEAVGIFLEGRPQYPGIWLGLSKIGAIGALINTNQRKEVFLHSMRVSKCKHLVYGAELEQAVEEVKDQLEGVSLYRLGKSDKELEGVKNFDTLLDSTKVGYPKTYLSKCKQTDKFLYIYTSGTTGLPKAAILTHARFSMMALGPKILAGLSSSDVVYTPLPLYHSAGGILGVGQVIYGGSTVVIRPKFSASNFWKDCIKYNCTVAQYIGEMCRYLMAVPERPEERAHQVRVMYGNGLRPQIWDNFAERFAIDKIIEFYGATEGNASLINAWNQVGAVGYVPWFAKKIYPVDLIKVNEDTNEPIRSSDGLCIPCPIGEPGLLVGKIIKSRAISHYNGYVDEGATNKKILRDVFVRGDSVFNSGDILIKDAQGYFYFKDRTGDTFRWKGENVATSEVEAVISNVIGLKDAIVYGVQVPDSEGRAGMAAIVDKEGTLDLEALCKGLKTALPPYSRPIFIRILKEVPMTGTFKLKKVDLQKEGYDLSKVSDPLYFLDPREGKYVAFDQAASDALAAGAFRL